jgi:hypothetical protein
MSTHVHLPLKIAKHEPLIKLAHPGSPTAKARSHTQTQVFFEQYLLRTRLWGTKERFQSLLPSKDMMLYKLFYNKTCKLLRARIPAMGCTTFAHWLSRNLYFLAHSQIPRYGHYMLMVLRLKNKILGWLPPKHLFQEFASPASLHDASVSFQAA